MTRNCKIVEIGILLYPGARTSVVQGLTELFAIADRLAEPRPSQRRTVLRVSHWRRSTKASHRITRVFETPRAGKEAKLQALIVPPSLGEPLSPESSRPLARWLASKHDEGATLCSVCTGAFVLAQTGLLAKREATTHWFYANALQRLFPNVRVQAQHSMIDDEALITTGGIMAWTDLGLRLVQRYLGEEAMRATARYMLLEPPGKPQQSFVRFSPNIRHEDAAILRVQGWIAAKGAKEVSLKSMATKAGLRPRTFLRRFYKATGYNPVDYCQRVRVEKARELLERTSQNIDAVSRSAGYEDCGAFRRVFHKVTGLGPTEYRGRFGRRK